MPRSSKPDTAALAASGALTTRVLVELARAAKPGVTKQELNDRGDAIIRDGGGTPAFLGHGGFPGSVCLSVNEEIVHGLPSERKLAAGDLLKIDAGAKVDGWFTDAAITVEVGRVKPDARKLRQVTEQALDIALAQVQPGNTVGDLGAAVQAFVEGAGMGVIRDCTGHGIGKKLHDEPSIPNFGSAAEGPKFEEGMVVAIEPMVSLGNFKLELAKDKWTLKLADGSLGAHVEETVMVSADGPVRFTPVRAALSGEKADDKLMDVAHGR